MAFQDMAAGVEFKSEMCIKSQYLLKGSTTDTRGKKVEMGVGGWGVETGRCPIIMTERAKTAIISLGLLAFALC